MPDSLYAFRAIARSARRRILARLAAAKGSRAAALTIVRRELAEVEPLLARTIRDAQLLEFLTGSRDAVKPLALLPVAEAIKPAGPTEIPEFRKAGIVEEPPTAVALDVGQSRNRLPPSPPGPFFPDQADDPPPVVRLPQVERAAHYLHTRLDYTPEEFAKLDADARRVGFTLAKAQSLDTVTRVRKALQDDVERGGTLKAFKAVVREALDQSALADHQVEAVYRTHTARAYSAGQIDILDHPLVTDEFPYLLYDYTHDARVRPEHVYLGTHGLDGTGVYRRDDPFWKTWFPPCGWNCRCVAVPLSLEDAAARGVREAIAWLRTGEPPARPAWVEPPPFGLPKGWVPVGDRLQVAG